MTRETNLDRTQEQQHCEQSNDDQKGTKINNTGSRTGILTTDGGCEIQGFDAICDDDFVRNYRVGGNSRIYAYRSDDEEQHIVVARGEELGTHWEQRVPAVREYAVPGQKLWTIPDNWEKQVYSKRDTIAYAMFYIPESDTWVRVSNPTNNRINDAWYRVLAVGTLRVDPVGDIGTSSDVRRLADEIEGHVNWEAVLEEVAANWTAVVDDLQSATEWVREYLSHEMPTDEAPVHADQDWAIEFHDGRVFQPRNVLEPEVDLSEYDVNWSVLLGELRRADLLPNYYNFTLSVDDSELEMEYYVDGLIEAGLSPGVATDYYKVEVADVDIETWADTRGVDSSTVSRNRERAEEWLSASKSTTE